MIRLFYLLDLNLSISLFLIFFCLSCRGLADVCCCCLDIFYRSGRTERENSYRKRLERKEAAIHSLSLSLCVCVMFTFSGLFILFFSVKFVLVFLWNFWPLLPPRRLVWQSAAEFIFKSGAGGNIMTNEDHVSLCLSYSVRADLA
jgi:hypothetical protein